MSQQFIMDLAERSIRTFIQAALGVVALNLATVTSIDTAKGLFVSAVAAGVSAIMSLISKNVGTPDSGSVLPPVS
jgi:hypothetical protein